MSTVGVGFFFWPLHYRTKQKPRRLKIHRAFGALAEWTGLEPATPDVTGRYSNQLNYHSVRINLFFKLSSEEKRILQTLLKIASPQRVLVFCQKRCVLHNDCAFYRKLSICQEHAQIFFGLQIFL